jgi:hypothetical protein
MAATVYDVNFNGTILRQVMRSDYNASADRVVGRYSGGVDPQQISLLKAEPKISVDSGDLAGAIALASITTGIFFDTASTIVIPFNGRANGGVFSGGESALTATKGLLIPTSFSAQQDSEDGAKASLDFYPISDGTTAPVVASSGGSLAGQVFNAMYSLGPANFNSTDITGLTGVDVKPGLTIEVKRYRGLAFAELLYVTLREPSIELTFEDTDALATFGALFAAATSTVVYFRKRDDGSTHVADGTGVHTRFTLTGGLSCTDNLGASGQSNAEAKATIWGKTLAVSTTSSIA